MNFYNTLTRRVDPFTPLETDHVRLYSCGPTVYDYAHIGNFRAYVFEDILRRSLKYAGYRVTQVMNLTDVDDKTIRGARAAGLSLEAYTRTYKDAFFEDLRTLNIEPAEHYPAATDHVPEMIELIGMLFDRGYAYRSDDGSVYFSIAKFGDYGKLAHLDLSGLRAGARVAQDEYEKENVADFALWKAWQEEDGDVAWDAPWGRGRPGWHIECSAMSRKYLGDTFDIHTGGVDNIFPHHEDEIAQSEGATGKPFVTTWLHCAHLIVEGRKMSKSLGNFYTLRDVLERGYAGREVRYVLLSAHYRQRLNFTFEALDAAREALRRLDEFKTRVLRRDDAAGGRAAPEAPWVMQARTRFREALENDLGISEALAAVFEMVSEGNRRLDAGGDAAGAAEALEAFDSVLGVLGGAPEGDAVPEAVAALSRERDAARKARQWAEADRLRDVLAARGWDVRDTPEGTCLRRR
ncbi:MAG: cysteine--tRNA ligase [Lentisphaerae bacterium]|nr:cysteine--tRNA ligase [Lentisphaerota bacterium]